MVIMKTELEMREILRAYFDPSNNLQRESLSPEEVERKVDLQVSAMRMFGSSIFISGVDYALSPVEGVD